jgi:ABC-type uncharacterized transport system YnjBCD ATPase subunit
MDDGRRPTTGLERLSRLLDVGRTLVAELDIEAVFESVLTMLDPSVTLTLAVGLLKPDSGRIIVDGEDITKMSENELAHVRRNAQLVFQSGALFDSLSVWENVAFPLSDQGLADDIRDAMLQLPDLAVAENGDPNVEATPDLAAVNDAAIDGVTGVMKGHHPANEPMLLRHGEKGVETLAAHEAKVTGIRP